ncbi:MAG: hypothetical protein B7Y25_08505 [Alphaproteobacteria bacterium 16-39-46]|nr:MAG: hypothetical protein B7Y25_08505 [Alphaproteobacteria bacterium 16-39-46]OZA41040.1 MAG: hypothetical protein B7X84_08680 [Alphaproteobacteria bacterium 17-39-52]HQS84478.1 MAP7 domain-containing protein [Alphaproteobacteria bacterium]HQS94264.1 MAP7 domain-containing protein [Alphaproteobacteria bacterium]
MKKIIFYILSVYFFTHDCWAMGSSRDEEIPLSSSVKSLLKKAQTAPVKDLVELFPNSYRVSGLRHAISTIPNMDRHWVLIAVLHRYQSSTPKELVNVITLLPSVPKVERKRFLEIAYNFEGTEPSIILPLLKQIETQELVPLIRDVKTHDPSGKWLLTALPIQQMHYFRTNKRPLMFERLKGLTGPLLQAKGFLKEDERFTLGEVRKLHDMTPENYESLRYLFSRVLENPHGFLHKLLQLPEDDFRNLSAFIETLKKMYQFQENTGLFFLFLDTPPSEREMCLDVWLQIATLPEKWLLTALPIDRMHHFKTTQRSLMFERVKGLTEPLLQTKGGLKEEERFTFEEVHQLHDMAPENYESLLYLFSRNLESQPGLLHKLLKLPEGDFRNLSDFISRFKEIYQFHQNISFFFPLIDICPSDRAMCLDVWQQAVNLSNIPTHPNDFHIKLMNWSIQEGRLFISLYQSFLTNRMTHHDQNVLLDQFLSPERYCLLDSQSKASLFPPYFIQTVGKAFEKDILAEIEERHRFTRLVDLIENPSSSLKKYFEAERRKEQLLREQRELEQRIREQRDREEQARRKAVREWANAQARLQLQQEQRILQSLEREQRSLNERSAAIPAFREWVTGQEAMMREKEEVTTAVLAIWQDQNLQKYKPNAHEIDRVFQEKFCEPIERIIAMRMKRIISDVISPSSKSTYQYILGAAIACREQFIERDLRFYNDTLFFYDERFPAIHQFFWRLRNAKDVTSEEETWVLGLLEAAYNKDPKNFTTPKIPEGFTAKNSLENPIPPPSFTEWVRNFKAQILPCLREIKCLLRNKEYFRLQAALQGLERVKNIRGDFSYDTGMPGIYVPQLRPFCGFLGNLSIATLMPEGFVQGWMTEHWKHPYLTKAFPELQTSASFGEALGLNPNLHHQMVSILTSALRNNETILPYSLPVISKVTKDYFIALFDPFDAIVDALFMAMRGHTGQGHGPGGLGQMTNPLWPHQSACADGVAVCLFRTTTENALTQGLASSLLGITVIKCNTPG